MTDDFEPTGAMLDEYARLAVDLTDEYLRALAADSWHRYCEVRYEQFRREHNLPRPEDLVYLDADDLADRAGQFRFGWTLAEMELARRNRLLEQLDDFDPPSG